MTHSTPRLNLRNRWERIRCLAATTPDSSSIVCSCRICSMPFARMRKVSAPSKTSTKRCSSAVDIRWDRSLCSTSSDSTRRTTSRRSCSTSIARSASLRRRCCARWFWRDASAGRAVRVFTTIQARSRWYSMENVETQSRDGILFVTINRPKVLNALNALTVEEIGRVFATARTDDSVRCVVITGAGEKAFVAGADINELAKMTPISGKFVSEQGQNVFLQIARFPQPVLAAINGFALGGGCELALACHIRIASENAQIGLPEVTLGIIPGYGGTQRMVRLLGKGRAFELICSGDRISAAEAEKIGLVNKVVPADQLMSAAEQMAKRIAAQSPVAVRAAIEAINRGSDMSFEEGQVLEATLFGLLCASEDMKEGMAAFLEKRKANFPGR